MTATRYRPRSGARIRKPEGGPGNEFVADDGEKLPATPYYARAIADGDLVAVPPRPKPAPATPPAEGSASA